MTKILRKVNALLLACTLLVSPPTALGSARSARAVRRTRDWFSLATNIQRPSDFRPFEPILEELTRQQPVPAHRVHLVSNEQVRRSCNPDAGGCYRPQEDDIFIGEQFFPSGRDAFSIFMPGFCDTMRAARAGGGVSLAFYSRFEIWLHEQGHGYDLLLGSSRRENWINQVEAEAFVFYAAEHIAKNYDRRLGLSLIANKLMFDRINRLFSQGFYQLDQRSSFNDFLEQTRQRINETRSEDFNPWNEMLADSSVLILLGSGFQSFGEVWHYIHTHSHDDVIQRIYQNVERLVNGSTMARRLIYDVSGVNLIAPETFDIAPFTNFDFRQPTAATVTLVSSSTVIAFNNGTALIVFPQLSLGNEYATWGLRLLQRIGTPIDLELHFGKNNGVVQMTLSNYATEPAQQLTISDVMRSDHALLEVGANPQGLPVCISSERTIAITPGYYSGLARDFFNRLIDHLVQINSTEAANFIRTTAQQFLGR